MLYAYLDSSGWVKRYYDEPGSDLTQLLFEKLLRPRQLQQRGNDLLFFSADNRLIRAAQSEGFSTLNPEVNTVTQLEAIRALTPVGT